MPEYQIPNIDGWMGPEELKWLFDRAGEMESIVEIGSWVGKSTHALLSGCKGTVWAVDHFLGSPAERGSTHALAVENPGEPFRRFKANVGHFENLKILEMDSIEASKKFERKSIDMVFIDGDHDFEAVKKDLMAWMPICKKLLCGHDASMGGVREALDACAVKKDGQVGDIWWSKIE